MTGAWHYRLPDVDREVLGVTMLSCDRYGFEVRIAHPDDDIAFGRIGFPTRLDTADEARGAMVALTRAARGA